VETYSCGCTRKATSPWAADESYDFPCRKCSSGYDTNIIGTRIEFIRYGAMPVSGFSTNHRDGTSEAGVSVYAVFDGEPRHVGFYYDIVSRTALRGSAICVGLGSDGEPLIDMATAELR
jgi:hypothetical protein